MQCRNCGEETKYIAEHIKRSKACQENIDPSKFEAQFKIYKDECLAAELENKQRNENTEDLSPIVESNGRKRRFESEQKLEIEDNHLKTSPNSQDIVIPEWKKRKHLHFLCQ